MIKSRLRDQNCVSMDTSGVHGDGREVRTLVESRLGGSGDPLLILIRLETMAERRLAYTKDLVRDDHDYIDSFINRNL